MNPAAIAFYVSAHGLGHWAQVAPVIAELMRRQPQCEVLLRSSLPRAEVDARLPRPIVHEPTPVDVGVIQRHAVEEDFDATWQALEKFHEGWRARVEDEAQWLRRHRVGLVVSDIAPLGLAAAQHAGIPNLALGSLDWHEIYAPFFPAEHPAMRHIEAAYRNCELLLKLPMSMPMALFRKQCRIPLIGRMPSLPAGQVRSLLGLDPGDRRPLALIMFGGSGTPPFHLEGLAKLEDWRFLLIRPPASASLPANVHAFDPHRVAVPDAMQLADVVVCKPGYGTLAEAWLSGTPVCYIPRPGFPEYPHLRRWLQAHAPCSEMPLAAFRQGEWAPWLAQAASCPRSYPQVTGDGAAVAAARMLEILGSHAPMLESR